MISLGFLPVSYDEERSALYFQGRELAPDIRALGQARPTLCFPEADAPNELYYMYRNICLPGHREAIKRSGLRYDITIIPSLLIGGEHNKTVGHFHPNVPGTDVTYSEVYEVLHGEAHYLLQSDEDAIAFIAKKGDKAVVPPGYGHITINPSEEPLIMANWVAENFGSEYGSLREMHGGFYYFISGKGWVRNPNYEKAPALREMRPAPAPHFGLEEGVDMYTSFMKSPERFRFLTEPQNFLDEFSAIAGRQ